MEKTITYETIVEENGTIRMPRVREFARQRVQILIRPLEKDQQETLRAAEAFFAKWGGILKDVEEDPETIKLQYLLEKYG